MAEGKASRQLVRVFWILFGAAFALALAAALLSRWQKLVFMLPAAVLLWGVYKLAHSPKVPVKYLLAAFALCFTVFLGLQWHTALTQYHVPTTSGDLEAVYTGVKELVENGHLTESALYFLRHRHQAFVLVELYAAARTLLMLGGTAAVPYAAFGMLAALGIDAAVLLLMGTVYLQSGARRALCVGFYALLLTPLINSVTYAYTHVLGMPYLFLALFLFMLATRCKEQWQGAALCAAAGAVLALGCQMSGSAHCVLVALCIWLVLRCDFKTLAVRAAALLLGFALFTAAFNLFWQRGGLIDMEYSEAERIPATHWVMVGLNERGDYSEEDLQATVAIRGQAEKQAYHLQEIGRRLAEMGPVGFVRHLLGKIASTWQGMPYGGEVLPGPLGYLQRHGLYTALLLCCLLGAAYALKKPRADFAMLCCLCLFGLFLLLLVWETANRYIMPYLPLLLPPAAAGAEAADALIQRLRRGGKGVGEA